MGNLNVRNMSSSSYFYAGTMCVYGDVFIDKYSSFITKLKFKVILGNPVFSEEQQYQRVVIEDAKKVEFYNLILRRPFDEDNYEFNVEVKSICNNIKTNYYDEEPPVMQGELKSKNITTKTVTLVIPQAKDNYMISRYEIYRNGGLIAETEAGEYTDNNLKSNTSYIYIVYAFDGCNNYTGTELLEIKTLEDKEPPSKVDGLKILEKTPKSISIVWNAAEDNHKIEGYEIYRDGIKIATVKNGNSYTDKSPNPNIVYNYSVIAYDEAGNYSVISDKISACTLKPKILSVTPEDGSKIGGGNTKLAIVVDNTTRIEKIQIYYRESKSGNWVTLSEGLYLYYSINDYRSYFDWNISKLETKKEYELKVRVYDKVGNCSEQISTYTFTNEPPTPPTNLKAETDNGANILSFNPATSIDVTKYAIYRKADTEVFFTKIAAINGGMSSRYTDKTVEAGKIYEYYLTAVDEYGKESLPTDTVNIFTEKDKKAPEVSMILPESKKLSKTVSLKAEAKDNLKVESIKFYYRKENADNEEKTYIGQTTEDTSVVSFDTTKCENGACTIIAIAVDEAGNESIEEFTKRYEIDNQGIGKMTFSDCTSASTSIQLRWEDVEETDFAYFMVEEVLDTSTMETKEIKRVTNTLGYNVTGLSPETSYSYIVTAYDNCDNRGESSDIITISTTADEIAPVINSILPKQSKYKDALNLSMQVSDNYQIGYGVFSYSLDNKTYNQLAKVTAKGTSSETLSYTLDISDMEEGEIYIKFEAYDKYGNKNALLSDGTDVISKYIIDHTAPSRPKNVLGTGSEGYAHIQWEITDDDVSCYKIERAEGDSETFTLISGNHNKIGYYDTSVTAGNTYRYRVSAVDIAGNVSVCSKEVTVQVREDKEVPGIAGLSPANNSTTGKKVYLQVAVTDNSGVEKIIADIKSADDKSQDYERIAEYNAGGKRSVLFEQTLDLSEYNEGKYEIRVYATDIYGNISNCKETTFILDKTAPSSPDVTFVEEGYKITLNIEKNTEEDFYCYKVLRADYESDNYKVIATISKNTYTDTGIEPLKTYKYRVEAYDNYNNYVTSQVYTAMATDEDKVKPTAVLTECVNTLTGYETAFDGSASTDNVKIAEYKWDMGNGDTMQGPGFIYTYDKAGDYLVTLTVTDTSGNEDSKTMAVRVLDVATNAVADIIVTDTAGNRLSYADVYIKNSTGDITTLKTDGFGYIQICDKEGIYEVAGYANGYLPKEIEIELSRFKKNTGKIVLEKGDLIVGELTVEKMELQEIIDAGVDISNPNNLNQFAFTVQVKLEEKPVPETITYISTGNGGELKPVINNSTSGGGGGITITPGGGGGSTPPKNLPKVVQIDPEEPIIAVISTAQTVSWLKEMYNVNLSILNAADSKYIIENSQAELILPDGVSLAETIEGQSKIIDMGDIAGQQKKNASWIVKGDKSGTYKLEADFSGTLMPFERKVSAHFEAENEFSVSTGEGLHIIISPESKAYIDENYYIQFKIVNESDRSFYNFSTSLGSYSYEEKREEITINDEINDEVIKPEKTKPIVYTVPSGCSQIPVLCKGDIITVPVLNPGDEILGTYYEKFSVQTKQNPEAVAYNLKNVLIDTLAGEVTGVKITVEPIDSHITRSIKTYKQRKSFFGDPIDLTTGAFTDNISVISVSGVKELNFDIEYNSMMNTYFGENGKGFSNNFETLIKDTGNSIIYKMSAGKLVTFVEKNSFSTSYKGTANGNIIYLENDITFNEDGTVVNDKEGKAVEVEYVPISTHAEDFKVIRRTDGTIDVITPAQEIYTYDATGRNIKITDNNGRVVTITYTDNKKTVTDPVTGKSLVITYNEEGMVTEVSDGKRKATFEYEGELLTSYTNLLSETTTYTYDEKGRMLTQTDCEGVTYVSNIYDDNGRVISQTDADETKNALTITYTEEEKYDGTFTTVTATDANGNTGSIVVNPKGLIVQSTDNNGNITEISYDDNGNEIYEKDALSGIVRYAYDEKNRQTSVTDQNGNTTSYQYDDRDNVTVITDSLGNSSYHTYDEKNLLTSVTDFAGGKTTYEYNENAQVTKKTIEGIGSITYEYENGMLTKTTDSNGNVTKSEYDEAGRVTKIINPDNTSKEYVYDKMNRPVMEVNEMGYTKSYTYDKYGNKLTETDEMGRTTTYEYDITGKNTAVITPDGKKTAYEYDSAGNLIKVTNPDGTEETFKYDAMGNVTEETNELNETVKYEYNELSQLVKEISSSGKEISYIYDLNGKLTATKYPDGSMELYTYDENGNIIKTSDGIKNHKTYEYDAMGRVIKETDALSQSITYEYDSNGRLIGETDKNGNKTTYSYDGNGNCISKAMADGTVARLEYDNRNRLTKVSTETKENGEIFVLYKYDSLSRLIKYTDEDGNSTTYEYDKTGNLIKETNPNGYSITYEYDLAGNMVKRTDEAGNESCYEYGLNNELLRTVTYKDGVLVEESTGSDESTDSENADADESNDVESDNEDDVTLPSRKEISTSYSYDKTGRLVSVTDPLDSIVSCIYDSDGNMISVTDAMGGTTSYEYDSMGRKISETNPIGCVYSNTYNASGLLESSKNARNQETKYTYDEVGRLISTEDEAGTITYEYDANGNVLKVTEEKKGEDKETKTIERTYDSMNRVTSYTDTNGNTITYGYDELGNIITLTYPGGEVIRYTYYSSGRKKTVTDSQGRVTYYTYDGVGNVISIDRPDGTREERTYDEKGNVTVIKDVKLSDNSVINEYHYTYDNVGNIISSTGNEVEGIHKNLTDIKSIKMEYDEANRLIRYNGEEVKYDADGNMIYGPLDGKMVEYEYDCRNRLIRVGDTTYEYDAENTLISKTTKEGTTTYVTDVAGSLSQVLESSYKAIGKNNYDKSNYIYGTGLLYETNAEGIDVERNNTGTNNTDGTIFYHYNNLGSTTKLTNESGEIVEKYTYGTYGELLSGDSEKTEYLYNGMYGVRTDENGLYHMRARFYNTEIKRFINQDILRGDLTNSQSLNRYSYVQGNPLSYTDPFGLSPLKKLNDAGHSFLTLVGMECGIIGGIADFINGCWYMAEGNTTMATLSFISGLPAVGNVASGTLSVMKCAKAAKIVSTTTKAVSTATTFTMASVGVVSGAKNIYNNVKNGEFFTWDTLFEAGSMALNVYTASATGKSMWNFGKSYAGNVAKKWSGVKETASKLKTDNRGILNISKTSYGKSSLKFGENDLVYGPSASGKLVELQRSAGGKLLSDVGNPYDMGYGSDWLKFSTDTIENTVKQGNYIHFDLTNMQDVDGILNGTSKYMNKTTSGELRYIRDNWGRLSGNIKFYNNGEEVLSPWMN
ncbi:MAG: PKD domain-containing protein [Lachnospiraceae bacterium]|nr:PKD domain-containing protein [Lachnospiraceae bacterium]